ncbi:DnaJ domain-containing protein [Alphaproteobacteria bacterium HT1-32]|nr:DnaJ domain-containing protein [Alphaproteobacteria bacterium HT1-32]
MSIWGKVVGVAAGLALGGPLGAIIGLAGGHVYDRMRGGETGGGGMAPAFGHVTEDQKRQAFAVGVIVLCAKMAKADGQVTRDEIDAFKRIFRVAPEDAAKVGSLFDEARKDAGGFEPYARQLGALFRNNKAVLEELLAGLCVIAMADGVLHPDEQRFLERVALQFDLPDASVERIIATHIRLDDAPDPYKVLGVTREMSDDELKSAYRKLVRDHHPDRLVAQGMPDEFIDQATEKLATINASWDRIEKERGLN